jgi:uncharacterized protein (TIGR02147 family)
MFRDILLQEYQKKRRHNPRYSARAFARDLNISPSSLSEIFSGKKGISSKLAKKICDILDFPPQTKEVFIISVQISQAKSSSRRQLLNQKLNALVKKSKIHIATTADLSTLSWMHFAIIECLKLKDAKPSVEWLAQKLNTDVLQITEALNILQKMKWIEINRDRNKLSVKIARSESAHDVSAAAISDYHQSVLNQATKAIAFLPHTQREYQAVTLNFSSADVSEAKQMIQRFVDEFIDRFGDSDHKDSVTQLNVQFFKLTK